MQEESDTSDEEDEDAGNDRQNVSGEVIPIVPPAQHHAIDTDLDMSDGKEQTSVSND